MPIHFFAPTLILTVAVCNAQDAVDVSDYPLRPIKLIVPFAAGGGSDTFVRILQKAVEEHKLLPQPLVVINVPGAGGTIGSRQVKDAQPDGYTLMCLHEGIITAKHADKTDYGPESFEPIAGTGETAMVIAVAKDAKYANLKELMEDAARRPDEIVYSANIGAPSHFVGLMLENARPGARFRYTQTGGGAKRFAALAGGHIHVSAFSLAEYMQFKLAGLRALAVCAEKRHPAAPDVPTASEQGLDVISSNMQFWWAPKGTPANRIAVFAQALKNAMKTRQVRDRLEAIHIDNVFLSKDALKRSLTDREMRIAIVSQRETTALPNFPLLTLGVVIALAGIAAVQEILSTREKEQHSEAPEVEYPHSRSLAAASVAVTGLYVFSMQSQWLGFRLATAIYVLILGLLLTKLNVKRLPALAIMAFAMSVGLHFIFTRVLVVDLP